MHELTLGRAWLRDVQVVLPQAWGRAACTPSGIAVEEDGGANYNKPDMLVMAGKGKRARSIQAGGCGERGERVELPAALILESNDTLSVRAGEVAREWIRTSYGVFPETGFSEDPTYPLHYSDGLKNLNNSGCPGQLLCPTADYDRLAPTKQNLLCNGRSVLEVMLDNPDLQEVVEVEEGGRQVYSLLAAPRDPVFSYRRPGPTQYVLILDQDQPSHRWTHLKRALYQFIELLPEGSVLSIVSTTGSASVLLPPTLVTKAQREGLLGRVPRRGAEQAAKCLQCGLQLGVDTLGELGGSLVLVTGAHMENLVVLDGPHTTTLLSYRGQGANLGRIDGEMTVYSILEDAGSQNPQLQLTEVFVDIINREEREQVQKVHESSHLAHEFSGTFYIEETQSSDVTITLNIDDEQKVELFEVKDPSGKKNIFSKFGDGVVVFRLPGDSKPGIWSFHARLYAEARLPEEEVSVTVLTRGRGVRARGLATGQRLVAQVTSGNQLPVVGGQVTALVTGPTGRTQELILRDSGLGVSDVTRGDGLYTGILTSFSTLAGYYSVRLQIGEGPEGAMIAPGDGGEDCCGTWRPSQSAGAPTGQFTRFVTGPSVFLEAGSTEDVVPPSRIPDLTLVDTNSNSSSVTLAWSAPGGDQDQGKAEHYEIRCGTDRNLLASNFSGSGLVVVELVPAGEYGVAEQIDAAVPWAGEVFYYAVVAIDKAGNRGDVSNIVAAFIEEATTTVRLALPLSQEEMIESSIGSSWFLDRNSVALAGGVVGGVILVVVTLVIGLLVRARQTSSKPADDKESHGGAVDTYEAGFYPDIKISAAANPKLDGSREVYDWLEGSQGSSGSRPETAASTEESTASTGEDDEPGSPNHHQKQQPTTQPGDRYSFSYPPPHQLSNNNSCPYPRVPPEVAPRPHGRTSVTPRSHGGGLRDSCRGAPGGAVRSSGRQYQPRVPGGSEGPQRKRRHESVV